MSFAVLSLGEEETLGVEEKSEIVGDGNLPDWISEAKGDQGQFPPFLHFLVVVYFSFSLDEISLGTFALDTLYVQFRQFTFLLKLDKILMSFSDKIIIVISPLVQGIITSDGVAHSITDRYSFGNSF